MLSRETGIEKLDLNSAGVELLASKKLLIVTPYAGASIYRTSSTPQGIASLRGESFTKQRVFVGVSAGLPIGTLTVEADRLDNVTTFNTKIGLRF